MSHDPQEFFLKEEEEEKEAKSKEESEDVEYVTNISPSDEWLAFRNNMSVSMFNAWTNK